MPGTTRNIIAVVGATGHQGGAVMRALQLQGRFKVRALTRNPGKHRGIAEEVVEADLTRPGTLRAAFQGAYGVFLVTNFWQQGTDEREQAQAAIKAAKEAGVTHFIWSTLPDVETISGGKFHLPHFTGKAKIDRLVEEAGFEYHTFVVAPFYYQNLTGAMAPQKQPDGSWGWSIPIDPKARVIHMGDTEDLGPLVAGAFAAPNRAGHGEYLPLVGDFMSFGEIVETLNRAGHELTLRQVSSEAFGASFPGAAEVAAMFGYFHAHTYLGGDSRERIALADSISARPKARFASWAGINFPAKMAA